MKELTYIKVDLDENLDKILARYETFVDLGLKMVFILDKNDDLIFDILPILFAILADPDLGEKFENSIELIITLVLILV